MSVRDIVRGIGGILLAVGLMCLPLGFGANPKRDASAFFRAADTGIWLKLGVTLVLSGVVILLLSALFRDRR
jgi:hypothetical protein